MSLLAIVLLVLLAVVTAGLWLPLLVALFPYAIGVVAFLVYPLVAVVGRVVKRKA